MSFHELAHAAAVPQSSASTCVLRSRFTEDHLAAAPNSSVW
jgi:hypothetical protein